MDREVERLLAGVRRDGRPGVYETRDGERVGGLDGPEAARLDVHGARMGREGTLGAGPAVASLVLVDDVDDVEVLRDRVWRMHGYATPRLERHELVAHTLYAAVGLGHLEAISAAEVERRAEQIVTAVDAGNLDRQLLLGDAAGLRDVLGLPPGHREDGDHEAAHVGRRRCLDLAQSDRQRRPRRQGPVG